MAKLENIWIEKNASPYDAIRIDLDNDRHLRIAIEGCKPTQLINALREAAFILEKEIME